MLKRLLALLRRFRRGKPPENGPRRDFVPYRFEVDWYVPVKELPRLCQAVKPLHSSQISRALAVLEKQVL